MEKKFIRVEEVARELDVSVPYASSLPLIISKNASNCFCPQFAI